MNDLKPKRINVVCPMCKGEGGFYEDAMPTRFSPEERGAMERAVTCLNLTPDTGGLYSSTEDDDLAAATIRKMLTDE